VSGSAPPETLDQPASASAEPTDAAEQPARGEAQESPTPSTGATVPTTTPARTGSDQRDTRTTRAISPCGVPKLVSCLQIGDFSEAHRVFGCGVPKPGSRRLTCRTCRRNRILAPHSWTKRPFLTCSRYETALAELHQTRDRSVADLIRRMERHRAEVIAALPSSTCPARTTATVKCGEPGSAELGPTPTGASAVKPDPLARLSRSSGTAAGRVEIRDWARCPSGFLIGNPNRLSEQVRLRRHTRGGSDRDCVGQPAGRARSWSSPSPGPSACLRTAFSTRGVWRPRRMRRSRRSARLRWRGWLCGQGRLVAVSAVTAAVGALQKRPNQVDRGGEDNHRRL
jgi:hypothetical protein